jgi:serine/threonine-protein kinase
MSSVTERWRRLNEVFERALEMDPSRRTAFLSDVCNDDPTLGHEVDALLASADRTLSSLKRPVEDAARQLTSIGRHIGTYTLIHPLGEGGMGRVFLAARADEQYRQFVALKLIHAGFTETELERFRAERQILASLNHPNIARLLDGGMTSDGTPYLVMEYVEGVPIDEYCRGWGLSIDARLGLFRNLCSAVEYAHRNLVVHRDIKPANVLVSADGVPKLLDFGIAKLLDPGAQRNLANTQATGRLMTPAYASPEQLRGERVTTATDVYGLGVLLYDLLAGSHPFAQTDNTAALVRQICELDPPAPSSVVERHEGSASADVRKLKTDLDYIVMKAMRKEPERRYASAAELSADVSAYFQGYPVRARTGSWSYSAGKFVRRHTVVVGASIVLAMSFAGFGTGMALLTARASRERLRAERTATFLADMFRAARPDEARGRMVTARELLDRGAARVDKELAGQPTIRASLLHTIGDSYSQLGLYDQARELAERSYRLRAQVLGTRNEATAESLFLLANTTRLKGEYGQAEPLFRQVVDIHRANLGDDNPVVADALSFLGECLELEEKDTEAESKLRQALTVYRRHGHNSGAQTRDYLARLLEKKGEYLEAVQLLQEAVEIDKRSVGTDSPTYTMALHNHAGALARLGDLFAAEVELRESVAIERRVLGSEHPNLGYALNLLGVVALDEGDWRTAEPLLRESLALWSRLGPNHTLTLTGLGNWARVLQAQGEYDEARTYFQRALGIAQQPTSTDTFHASWVLSRFALLEFDARNYSAAEGLAERALAMQRAIIGGGTAPETAKTMITLAEARVFQGDPASAEPILRSALEILKAKFPPRSPPVTAAQMRLGEALTAKGDALAAEPILREALASAYAPPFRIPSWQVGEAESALGWCLGALGRVEEAQGLLERAQQKLLADPRPIFRIESAAHLRSLGGN